MSVLRAVHLPFCPIYRWEGKNVAVLRKKFCPRSGYTPRAIFTERVYTCSCPLRVILRRTRQGVADSDDARWDIARHDAACADNGIVPYRHAGQHRHVRADPDVYCRRLSARAISRPALRCSTSSGCPAAEKQQFGAMNT